MCPPRQEEFNIFLHSCCNIIFDYLFVFLSNLPFFFWYDI